MSPRNFLPVVRFPNYPSSLILVVEILHFAFKFYSHNDRRAVSKPEAFTFLFVHLLLRARGPVRRRRCVWDTAHLLHAVPILLDLQVPLPGQVIRLVVVCEAGLDVVGPSDDHALGSFLHRSEELVLLHPWAVAADHVHGFIH